MQTCKRCNTSYESQFNYCPYCGQPKVPTDDLDIAQKADIRSYEEGILRLKYTCKTQVLWLSKGFLFGMSEQKAHVQIGHIELVAINHSKGEYVAKNSESIRGLQRGNDWAYLNGYPNDHLEECWRDAYNYIETGKPYNRGNYDGKKVQTVFETILQERKLAWENFCLSLVTDGWFGITDTAIGRRNPWTSEINLDDSTLRRDFWRKKPEEPLYSNLDGYRYRRYTK
ncbi:MAG: hypothetical protein WBO46_19110 [Caldilineaceae bacterium]